MCQIGIQLRLCLHSEILRPSMRKRYLGTKAFNFILLDFHHDINNHEFASKIQQFHLPMKIKSRPEVKSFRIRIGGRKYSKRLVDVLQAESANLQQGQLKKNVLKKIISDFWIWFSAPDISKFDAKWQNVGNLFKIQDFH